MCVSLGLTRECASGAIYGMLAGALYGESCIPERWLAPVAMLPALRLLSDELLVVGQAEPQQEQQEPSEQGACHLNWVSVFSNGELPQFKY